MAIKKTVTTVQGFEAVDAYHRVECVEIQGKNLISYRVRSYKDDTGFPFFDDVAISSGYHMNGENPVAQAYSHLKTLPEFDGAVDC